MATRLFTQVIHPGIRPIGRAVALGDSLTAGITPGSSSYFDNACLLSNGRILRAANLGVSGATPSDVLASQVPQAIALSPDSAFLQIGINAPTQTTQYISILSQLLAAGIQVFIVSLFPCTDARVPGFNLWLRNLAARSGCRYIDAYTSLVKNDGSGNLAASYDSGDGLHPNQAGAVAAATAVASAVSDLPVCVPLSESDLSGTSHNLIASSFLITGASGDTSMPSTWVKGNYGGAGHTIGRTTETNGARFITSLAGATGDDEIYPAGTPTKASIGVVDGDRVAFCGKVTTIPGSGSWSIRLNQFTSNFSANTNVAIDPASVTGANTLTLTNSLFYVEATVQANRDLVIPVFEAKNGAQVNIARPMLFSVTRLLGVT